MSIFFKWNHRVLSILSPHYGLQKEKQNDPHNLIILFYASV